MSIEVQHITKTFGAFTALDDVSLAFPDGKLVALLGPSGCGKTTLLRIIAGLEMSDTGRVLLEGEDASDRHVRERQVGFVFQHYALFRHMTVFDNVAFGLTVRPAKERWPAAKIKARVDELLDLVQLGWLAKRYPAQLSGGQRQRIALARALAVSPRVLLLDEPFGALDAKVRKELRRWLRNLHDELHITSIFVTHDQEEALELADRVVLMNKGRIEQIGSATEVYAAPATPFVMGFLGSTNQFRGRIEAGGVRVGADLLPCATAHLSSTGMATGDVIAYARPHEMDIVPNPDVTYGIAARVDRVLSIGAIARVELTALGLTDGQGAPLRLDAELTQRELSGLSLDPGQRVRLVSRNLRIFPAHSDPAKATP
jgi:sulfate/thiosulfate transport system ATP-binding protein